MEHAFHAHGHQILVLGEDGRCAVPGLVGRLGRHPVDAIVGEEVDPLLPALAVEEVCLLVEELLHRVLDRQIASGLPRHLRGHRYPCMYCDQAFIWFRIGASEVPQFGAVSTTPSFSMSRPRWRAKLTQSPPSDDRP